MTRKALFRFLPSRFAILLAPLVAAWPLATVHAQSVHTWNGGGASPLDWSDPTNWTGGAPDGNDEVNMLGAGGGTLTNAYAGATSQYRLFFNAGAGSYTLNGPPAVTFFDFGGNAPKIENNATGTTQRLNFGVVLDGTGSGGNAEVNPVDGNLVLGSTLDLAGTTTLNVWGNNGNMLTVEGALSSSGNGGLNGVSINQNSVLWLKGANTYNGSTVVNNGELRLGNSTQGTGAVELGATSGAANALFSLTNNTVTGTGVTVAKAVNVRSGSSGVKTIGNTGVASNTLSGNIALSNPVTFDPSAGSQLRLTGIISGAQATTVNGAGMTVFGGVNTFTGQTTVKSGATLGLIPAAVTLGTSSTLGNTCSGNETIVESGGTLNIGGSQFGNQIPTAANNEVFRIAGSGVGGQGALINTISGGNNALSKVVLTANATLSAGGNNQVSYGSGGNIITGNGRTDIRQSAAPTPGQAHLDLAGNTLTIAGNHLHALVNVDVSDGSFVVNAGQLNFEVGTIFNTGTGTITVNPGGRVGYWTSTANQVMSVNRPVILNGGTYGDPTSTSAAFIAPSPVTITGTQNPNFTALNNGTLSGVISQSAFTGTGVDKRGAGVLAFNNPANSFSAPVNIYAGTMRGDYTTTIAGGVAPSTPGTTTDTPLGTNTNITVAGGTLSLRANMANDATNQRWASGLNVTVDRAPGGMTFDRIGNATQTDKNVTLASLTIAGRNAANGWSIGQGQFTFTQGNGHRLQITNMTMNQPVVLNTGDYTIDGSIFSPGRDSLQKIGGNSWGIIGGGIAQEYNAVFNTGATQLRIGSMFGTAVTSNSVTLGTGPIYTGPNNATDFFAPGNIAAGQPIEVKSQMVTQSSVNFRTGFTSVPDNLRLIGGGIIGVSGNTGMGNVDFSLLGDGTWRYGADFGGAGAGTVTGVTSPGAGGVVRTGGRNTVTFSAVNAITGNASHEVGSGLINAGFRTNFNGGAQNGTTVLNSANNYTGGTTVNRSSVLNTAADGALGTGPVTLFGTLNLTGAATLTTGGNALSVNGGATINFDQAALTGAGSTDKYGDNTDLTLTNAVANFGGRNNGAAITTENIGNLNVSGGNTLTLTRGAGGTTGNIMRLEVDNVVRQNRGTLELIRTTGTGAGWGVGQFLNVTGTAPTVTNGMVAPWIVMQNNTPAHFANYSGGTFTPVTAYDETITTGTYVAGTIVDTDKVTVTTTDLTLTDDPTAYALRSERSLIVSGANDTVTLRSGGLILSNTADNTTVTINPALVANDGAANSELLVYTAGGGTGRNYAIAGAVTAAGVTKFGTGNLILTANNTAQTGTFVINGGTVQANGPTVTGNHSPLGTGQIVLAGGQFNVRSNATTAVAFTMQNTGITIAQNIPIATVDVNRGDAASTNLTMTINPAAAGGAGLVLQGSPGEQGQTLNLIGGNGYALTFGSNALNSFTGNVTLHTGSANLTLNNNPAITAPNSTITKSGGNTLIVGVAGGSPSVASGTKVVLNDGTLEMRSVLSFGTAATTSLELNRGTLNLRRDTAGTYGNLSGPGYNVSVNGSSTISVDRAGGTNTNMLLTLGNLNIANDVTLTANSVNGFGLGLASLNAAGTAILASNIGAGTQDTGAVRVAGALSGGSLVKLGGAHLHLVGTGTMDGGLFANAGYTRLRAAGAAGTGTITLNPGAVLDFNAANNLNVGQSVVVNSTPAALAMISANADGVAHPTAGVDTTNASTGVIGLSNASGGTYNTVINMASLYGGRWSLGGVAAGAYDPRYTAPSLGVGADNLYRLGGGGTAFFLGFNAAGATQNNVLSGALNSVRIGFDSGNIYTGTAASPTLFQLHLGGTNDYGGSTVIHRGTPARAWASAAGGTSAFGTGTVDVFGTLALSGAGTLVDGSGNATNALTLHAGSTLVLDNNGASGQAGAPAANVVNRIADSQAINLKGSLIDFIGNNNNPSTETLGTVTIGGASRIRAIRAGTGTTALTITNLSGTGTAGGSLLLQTSAAGQLGLPAGDRIIASNLGTVAMVDPRVVNYTDGQFVGHDATNGFVNLTGSTAITGAAANLPTGLAPSVNLNIAAAGSQTLSDNMTINSLRTDRDILNGGPFNKITLRSGGLLTATNTVTIQPDLIFNDGTQNIEARITAISSLVIQGQITANGITKAGAGQMFIRVPQPDYAGGWTVNSGDLIFDDPRAAGQSVPGNAITINGSTSTGGAFSQILGGNLGTASRVVFRYDNQTPENVTFTGGPINVFNEGTIQAVYANTAGTAANDRNGTIPSITLNSSSALSSVGLNIDVPNSRNRTVTPSLTLNANGTLRVLDGGSAGDYGRIVSFAVNSLVGANKNLLKIGNRALELTGDNSSTFTGGSINIGQGTVVVRHDGALGSSSTAVTVERNATLEIGKSLYAPANTSFTQNAGSSERWMVEDARTGTGGTYNLPAGVNLQLGTSILNSRTIGLNGGTIEGFLHTDSAVSAVQRDIESGVTLNLLANSSVGNAHLMQGATYDTGLLPVVGQPFGDIYRGVILNIKGAITGSSFDLTKIGQDTVRISGTSNTYDDTIISQGVLEIGADNALPVAGDLVTRTGGTFDLWGYNQTVGALGTGTGYTGGGVQVGSSGRITNTGVTLKTLTSSQAGDTAYNGLIERTVGLTKTGNGVLTLGNSDNTYLGATTVSGGVLSVNKLVNGTSNLASPQTSGIGQSSSAASNLILSGGGTLRYTGGATGSDRQFTLGDTGGAFQSNGAGPLALTTTAAVTHTGSATRTLTFKGTNAGNNTYAGIIGDGAGSAITSVEKDESGKWTLTNTHSYSGNTTIKAGTLALTAANPIPNTPVIDVQSGATLDVSAVSGGFTVGTAQTLMGKGTVTGATTLAGTISPGAGPGILSTGSVSTTASSTTVIEIGGLAAGSQYDQINTSGAISLGNGSLVISLINAFIPANQNTFDIWLNDDTDAVSGIFAGLPEGSQIDIPSTSGGPGGGLDSDYWIISYQGNTGNDIQLQYIPEPGSAALAAAASLIALNRRRRKATPPSVVC